jgi:hypothetical protein
LFGSTARRYMVLAGETSNAECKLLTSPIPRPGMFPPTLNGSFVSDQVLPLSVERRIEPTFGSHSFVYIPTARYKRLVSMGSVASASTPQLCLNCQYISFIVQISYQLLLPTESCRGVHVSSELRRYAPPISVRAYATPLADGLKTIPGTKPPPPG